MRPLYPRSRAHASVLVQPPVDVLSNGDNALIPNPFSHKETVGKPLCHSRERGNPSDKHLQILDSRVRGNDEKLEIRPFTTPSKREKGEYKHLISLPSPIYGRGWCRAPGEGAFLATHLVRRLRAAVVVCSYSGFWMMLISACSQEEICDLDHDGYCITSDAETSDCDDSNPNIHPNAVETCDGIDNNCNGIVDDSIPTLAPGQFIDQDADGFGTETWKFGRCVPAGAQVVSARGDCVDEPILNSVMAPEAFHPGATDPAGDNMDQDCGGTADPDPHVGLSSSDGSIELALNKLKSSGLQTIWIGPGRYNEVNLSCENCVLKSTELAGKTFLDGTGKTGSILRFAKDNPTTTLIVDGFTFQNGSSEAGGAALLQGGTVTFKDCIFENNRATSVWGGGAIAAKSATYLTLLRCSFQHNRTVGYGGALAVAASTLTIIESDFYDNHAPQRRAGGAIAIADANMTVEDSRFTANSAGSGGALYIDTITKQSAPTSIHTSQFRLNRAINSDNGRGGAIEIADLKSVNNTAPSLIISQTLFQKNSSASHAGAVDFNPDFTKSSDVVLAIDHSIFVNNTAEHEVGALELNASGARIAYSLFVGNTVFGTGKGLRKVLHCGGGISAIGIVTEAPQVIEHSIIAYNKSCPADPADIPLCIATPTPEATAPPLPFPFPSPFPFPTPAPEVTPTPPPTPVPVPCDACAAIEMHDSPDRSIQYVTEILNSIIAFNDPKNVRLINNTNTTWTPPPPVLESSDVYPCDHCEADMGLSELPSSVMSVEPQFVSYTDDGIPFNVHLALSSPLIDTGDATERDPDGTRTDMGLFGGPGGDDWDLDGDGIPLYFWPGYWQLRYDGFPLFEYDVYFWDDITPEPIACP